MFVRNMCLVSGGLQAFDSVQRALSLELEKVAWRDYRLKGNTTYPNSSLPLFSYLNRLQIPNRIGGEIGYTFRFRF